MVGIFILHIFISSAASKWALPGSPGSVRVIFFRMRTIPLRLNATAVSKPGIMYQAFSQVIARQWRAYCPECLQGFENDTGVPPMRHWRGGLEPGP